jgi:hypothetical protein
LLYRYTQDAELKNALDATVADCLTTQQPNGSISVTPMNKQPGGKKGDIFERHDTMFGMLYYYELVNRDKKVLDSVIKQADCIIAQIGEGKKDLFCSGES